MQRLALLSTIRQCNVAVLQDPAQVEIVVATAWRGSLMQLFWFSVHADVLFLPILFFCSQEQSRAVLFSQLVILKAAVSSISS
jgi:hypothetical protein